jgi:hypothetical protein
MLECAVCKKEVQRRTRTQRFCSSACRGKWKYYSGEVSTDSQYERISGNWNRYLPRLLYFGGRKRDKLTRDILMAQLVKQDFKCALSGVELTCKLEKGVNCPTNASVDRVVAGGPYTADNIQMVCRALNAWRSDTTVEDFVSWCQLVVNFHKQKEVANGNA